MQRRSEPSRTLSTTSTNTPRRRSQAPSEVRPGQAVAERLGLPVRDLDLLEQALVHSSWLHEHRDAARGHNERLEFLGDAVVNLAISEALFARHPEDDEGVLSARRAGIVSTTGLARLAGRLGLGSQLLLGEGEAARGGRRRPSLLASSFEALAGAIYLDLGWQATRDWLDRLAAPEIELDAPPSSLKSPKSRLQEYTQRTSGARPAALRWDGWSSATSVPLPGSGVPSKSSTHSPPFLSSSARPSRRPTRKRETSSERSGSWPTMATVDSAGNRLRAVAISS